MAVQFNYLAPRGWKPKNPDKNYLITLLKIELDEEAVAMAKYHHLRKGKWLQNLPQVHGPKFLMEKTLEFPLQGRKGQLPMIWTIKDTCLRLPIPSIYLN